jgi:hypothetical protein
MKEKPLRLIFLLLILSIAPIRVSAQVPLCDTLPIDIDHQNVRVATSLLFTADTAVIIPFVNNTNTNFAYPLMKLINLTPLPPGMTYYTNSWNVFASSWNVADTAEAEVDFVLTQPIPDNYTVTFEIHMSNFSPWTIDSCIFYSPIIINLNPVVTNINELNQSDFSIHPNPAKDYISITGTWKQNLFEIFSSDGRLITSLEIDQEKKICIAGFENGIYLIKNKASRQVKRFVLLRE